MRLLCLSFFLLAAVPAAAGEAPGSLASLLPAETIAYLELPAPLSKQPAYPKSAIGRIAAEPEMAAFLTEMEKAHRDFSQAVAEQAKLEPAFVDALLASRLSAALVDLGRGEGGGIEPAFVLAARFEAPPDRKKLFDALKAMANRPESAAAARNAGIPLGKVAWEEQYPGGHSVLMIAGMSPLRFVLLGDLLVFFQGPSSDVLKRLLAAHDEPLEAKTLGRHPFFARAREGAGWSPETAFLYANTQRIQALLGALRLPEAARVTEALGFGSVQALGCVGGLHAEGVRHTLYLHAPGVRRGLLAVPALKDKAELAAGELPAGAPGMLAARIQPASLYREVPATIDLLQQALQVRNPIGLAALAGRQEIAGVPAAELLGTLGDAVLVDFGPSGAALRFDLARIAEFEAAMAKMEKTLGAPFSAAAVETPAGPVRIRYFNRSGDPIPAAPSFCVLRRRENGTGTVLLATHPQPLKAILRRPAGKRLQESEDYGRVAAGLGQGYTAILYLDNRESYARVYDALLPATHLLTARPELVANLPILVRFLRPYFGGAVDPGRLPPGDALTPHLFGCALGVRNSPDGLTLTGYGPFGLGGLLASLADKLFVSNPAALGMVAAAAAHALAGDATPPAPAGEVEPAPADGGIPGIGQ